MARIKRKVSNKNVAHQKKQHKFLWTKKFWIIMSASLAVVIGAVVLIIVLVNQSSSTTNHNYFKETKEVEFNQTSYEAVTNYANPDYVSPQPGKGNLSINNIFVLVYDSSRFYPSESDDSENYNKQDETLLKRMIDLQKTVDQAKKNGKDVELFIIDAKYSFNINAFTSELFGGLYTDEDTIINPFLIYINEGEYVNKYNAVDYDDTKEDKEYYIASNTDVSDGTTSAYITNTLINRITIYINEYLGKDKI